MKNLQLIQTKINAIKQNTRFIKLAKAKRIEYYSDHVSELEGLHVDTIEKHNFLAEILEAALNIEKLYYFEKNKYKLISGLERHAYAPELNKIYFRNNTIEIKVPKCNTIEEAVKYIVTNQNLDQIKTI
jgi:hypothetical protein